jgi:hypothetical protein
LLGFAVLSLPKNPTTKNEIIAITIDTFLYFLFGDFFQKYQVAINAINKITVNDVTIANIPPKCVQLF